MAFIEIVPPRRARGETAEAYRYMARVGGHDMVGKIVQVFSWIAISPQYRRQG